MKITVNNLQPIIEFTTTSGASTPKWYRHLTVKGVQTLDLGNVCGTCPFLYENLKEVVPPISAQQLTEILKNGFQNIPQEVIDTVSLIIPSGEYLVGLFTIPPNLVIPQKTEQQHKALSTLGWGHFFIPSYIGRSFQLDDLGFISEAVIPLFSLDKLNKSTISKYQEQIQQGGQPTAIAISIVEGRHVMSGNAYDAPDEWTIMHFLIDGHHKLSAASEIKGNISLLSFLLLSEFVGGVTTHKHIPSMEEYIIEKIYGHKNINTDNL